jgi:hypothetical protein
MDLTDLRPNKTFQITSPTFLPAGESCLQIKLRMTAVHVDFGFVPHQMHSTLDMEFVGSFEAIDWITSNWTMVFANMTYLGNMNLVLNVVAMDMDDGRYLDIQQIIVHDEDCSEVGKI